MDALKSVLMKELFLRKQGIQDFLDGLNKVHRTLSNMIDFACEAREVGGVQILNLKCMCVCSRFTILPCIHCTLASTHSRAHASACWRRNDTVG